MKAILEFKLPKEQAEFDTASAAAAYRSILAEVLEQLRQQIKHGHNFDNPNEALSATRVMICNLLSENHVPWD